MSSIIRRGKSWRLKIEGARVNGRRNTSYITLGTVSRREAEAKAAKIIAAIGSGEYVDPSKETVAAFGERWLRDWAEQNVSAKTAERYEELLRTACQHVGGVPIQRLGAPDLARLYASLAAWSPRTRLHLHRAISRMLKHAVQWGVIARNPATMVDAPRVAASEIEILSAVDTQRALTALRGRTLYPIAAVALGTGMRRGELLALRRSDVDLDRAVLRVEQALGWTQRDGLAFRPPKTSYGRRSLTLAPSTVTVLREHLRAQLEQRLKLGLGKPAEDDLVFPNWKGEPRLPGSVTKEWAMAMRPLGITATFHSLRHTHASELIRGGVDILAISRRLGHGSAAITLSVYGHLIRPDDRAAQVIEASLTE
jgi:integrase